MQERVTLPAALWEAIVTHAREGKPEEICGIVRGRGSAALEVIRGRNIAPERIENYDVDPQTLLKQFDFEEAGDEMMGIYHSHPVSAAYPSATDAWNANYPESCYLICSLEFDAAPVVRGFYMAPHFPAADWAALLQALPMTEVRAGLFGWYLAAGQTPPAVLAALLAEAQAPLYVVIGRFDEEPDGRIVEIREVGVDVQ